MKMPPNTPENKPSRLLEPEENKQVFRLLGNRCQTIATAVVQLFITESPNHTQWVKRDTGVLCFVKDNIKKNYVFRLFCLKRNMNVWEHEMYNDMDYLETTSFLHIFEGQDGMVAFNFASTEEAKEVCKVVHEKIAVRKKNEEKRRTESATLRIKTAQPSQDYKKISDPEIKAAKRKRNITKADIGIPLDFKHVSHVGWTAESGFDVNVEDEELKKFFAKAGVSQKQLQNRKTREFIYNFINTNGGREALTPPVSERAPAEIPQLFPGPPLPPVPPRGPPKVQRAAPPPPPTNNFRPPPPKITSAGSPRSSDTTQPQTGSGAPPAPPPPPMPAMEPPPPPMPDNNVPTPPPPMMDMNSALLQSIREGTNLKPVEERKVNVADDSRNDLLSEIRKGFSLKPVNQREIKPALNNSLDKGDLASALARALAERSKVIHSDEDDEDEDDSNDEDWE